MKKSLQLKPLLLSLAVAGSSMAAIAPAAVQAEVSYNAAVSNFYLWRGQDISSTTAAVSGGIDYSHDSGLYAGVWGISNGASGPASTEFDLYAGYGFSSGDFGLNVALWGYFYPEVGTGGFKHSEGSLLSEYELTASYGDASVTAMIDTTNSDNRYYVLNYSIGAFGLSAGMGDLEGDEGDYTHYGISYAATDNLSFTVSKAQGDGIDDTMEKPTFNVAYSFSF